MKYADGQQVKLGDRVKLGDDDSGHVVAVIDAGAFSEKFPKADWSHLKKGILVEFPKFGLIYYETPEEDLELVARAATR